MISLKAWFSTSARRQDESWVFSRGISLARWALLNRYMFISNYNPRFMAPVTSHEN